MNKQYIAPQVEVSTLGVQSFLCASAPGPAPAPAATIGVMGGSYTTDQQW